VEDAFVTRPATIVAVHDRLNDDGPWFADLQVEFADSDHAAFGMYAVDKFGVRTELQIPSRQTGVQEAGQKPSVAFDSGTWTRKV
jgi:hypothetical protein